MKNFLTLALLWAPLQAFDPNPALASLPDNTAMNLGAYTCTSSPGDYGCQGIFDYGAFIYDAMDHQLLLWGGGHATTMRTDVDVFNFQTLSWRSDYPSAPCSIMSGTSGDGQLPSAYIPSLDAWRWNGDTVPVVQHAYDLLNVSTITKEMVVVRIPSGLNTASTCADQDVSLHPGRIPHYNLQTKKWSFSAIGPGNDYAADAWAKYPCSEYDPVSDKIIIAGDRNGIWYYDPVAQTKKKIGTGSIGGVAQNLVYFPPTDKFYAIATSWVSATTVWEITLDRVNWTNSTVVRLTTVTGEAPFCSPSDDNGETGFAYDQVNQIIGGAVRNGRFFAFHPITRTWTNSTIQTSPAGNSVGTQSWHAIAYDPVDNVFIFVVGNGYGHNTWAYRYQTAGAATENQRRISTPALLSVSPNPAKNTAIIMPAPAMLGSNKLCRVAIYDLQGRLVESLNVSGRGYAWKTGNYYSGVYVVKASTGEYSAVKRIVINK